MEHFSKVCLLSLIFSKRITSFCLLLLGIITSHESPFNTAQEHFDVGAASVDISIVTTWHGVPISWAKSWLRYHIGIGFTRIYLFFDDPKHDADVLRKLRNMKDFQNIVKIIAVDKEHRKKYWTLNDDGPNEDSNPEQWLLPAVGVHIPTEHTARQLLNVARAGALAKSEGMNWLLHIDSDEAFWVPKLRSGIAKAFFAQLDNLKITHTTFLNDEVVPRSPDYEFSGIPKDPFHQRLYFKRSQLILNSNQRAHSAEWTTRAGVRFFLGYMCGKSAINVKLWTENSGRKIPILPQHVTNFAYNYSQPGNISIINENVQVVLPYISSKKLKVALISTSARILHYVNPDYESMKKKFAARKKFNAKIFDTNLIAANEKKRYEKWRRNWIEPEEMPNWEFYNDMWSRVQKDMKTGGEEAYTLYLRAAVTPNDNRKMEKYLKSGLIYKNEEVRQFLAKISQLLEQQVEKDKNQLMLEIGNGIRIVDAGSEAEAKNMTYSLHRCKKKAPHFYCDVQNCCEFTTSPQFTFTKRLIGYKRYEAFQWWRPGLKWPM